MVPIFSDVAIAIAQCEGRKIEFAKAVSQSIHQNRWRYKIYNGHLQHMNLCNICHIGNTYPDVCKIIEVIAS